jgi:hypothetical protein
MVPGRLFGPLGLALGRLVAFVEAVAFWAAATFPFVYVAAGLLYVRESIPASALVLLGLVNAVAVVVGHRHGYEEVRSDE